MKNRTISRIAKLLAKENREFFCASNFVNVHSSLCFIGDGASTNSSTNKGIEM